MDEVYVATAWDSAGKKPITINKRVPRERLFEGPTVDDGIRGALSGDSRKDLSPNLSPQSGAAPDLTFLDAKSDEWQDGFDAGVSHGLSLKLSGKEAIDAATIAARISDRNSHE